jgi:acetyl esterase/lipase
MTRPELAGSTPLRLFEGARSYLGLQYAAPPGFRPLLLDLHVPDVAESRPVPVAVYAHGGGFLGGLRQMGPWGFLLGAGYAVASVDYRLSGECPFPGPVQDVAAAVRWVRAQAGEHGLDPGRVVGFGSSAGAYLIAAVALAGDAAILGDLGPTPEQSCRLDAVIDHYGPTDFLRMDDDAPPDVVELADAPGSSAARFLGFVPSARPLDAERATLARYANADSPPFLIAHGDADRRVGIGQSIRLRDALAGAGARAELVVLPGADHGTSEFDQDYLHETTLDFLRSALTPPRR